MRCQIVMHLECGVDWLDIGLTNFLTLQVHHLFDSAFSHNPVIGFNDFGLIEIVSKRQTFW